MPTAGDRCDHITESIDAIFAYVNGSSEHAFLADGGLQAACYYRFIVIGEAADRLCKSCPNEIAQLGGRRPSLPAGLSCAHKLRTLLAHIYHQVDAAIVWATIRKDLPQLRADVIALRALLP
ncbi:HepT-like ribonuclease domain-containing protein [Burkholderia lata]|uniref:HepT-like ribonuclease domain-containing protein n=1 Tax=Burkholderia lata (strain ATCC 17760 / DSM 23089 / LMG 22485 / NCIMB 9086 / R18194 / 383) TaxID=482957 RepID=UPI001584277D